MAWARSVQLCPIMKIFATLALLIATVATVEASNPPPSEWSAGQVNSTTGSFAQAMRVERHGDQLILWNKEKQVTGAIVQTETIPLSGAVKLSVRFDAVEAAHLGLESLKLRTDAAIPVDAMFVFDPLGGVRIDAVLRHPAVGGGHSVAQRSSIRLAPLR